MAVGSSAAVRAGGAFVEFFGKDHLSSMLGKLKAKVAAFGAFVGKIGSGAIIAGAALLAPVAVLFAGMLEKAKAGVFGEQAQSDAERFTGAFQKAITALQAALVPVLELITPWIEKIGKIVEKHSKLIVILLGVGAGLLAFGLAMKLAALAISGVVAAVTLLATVVGAILTPIGLMTAAVVGLGIAYATQTERGKEMTGQLKAGFQETADVAQTTWQAIIDDISRGDLEHAFKVVVAALKYEWAKLAEYWETVWIDFKMLFKMGWSDFVSNFKLGLNAIGTIWELGWIFNMRILVTLFNYTIGLMLHGWAELLDVVGANEMAKKLRAVTSAGPEALDRWENKVKLGHNAEVMRIRGEDQAQKAKVQSDRAREMAGLNAGVAAARGDWLALIAESAKLKAEQPYRPGGAVIAQAETAKGLFQSPNFKAALGIGDKISKQALELQKQQLAEEKKIVKGLENIKLAKIK